MKKKCQNGNLHIHYSNGKIKTIKKDGAIHWRTKKITLKSQKRLFN
jgi:hypothetical protein